MDGGRSIKTDTLRSSETKRSDISADYRHKGVTRRNEFEAVPLSKLRSNSVHQEADARLAVSSLGKVRPLSEPKKSRILSRILMRIDFYLKKEA